MPRRAADREALLTALRPEQRAVLEDALRTLGIGEHFHMAPGVVGFWELVAFEQLTEQIRLEEGVTIGRARIAAGIRLGLDADTVARRLRAQRRATMGTNRIAEKTSSTPAQGAA